MSRSNKQLVRDYFTALSSTSDLPSDLFTDDMSVWTTMSAHAGKTEYLAGLKLLKSLFPSGLDYHVSSLTAEDDRVAAEVQANGVLANGGNYHNIYVFMFRIRDGRIASLAEHFNPAVVNAKIMPLFQAANKGSG